MIFIPVKPIPYFFYVFVTTLALIAVMLTDISYCLKTLLALFVLIHATFSFYQVRKKIIRSFQYFETTQQYLLCDHHHQKHLAQLQPTSYQSQYFICLKWQLLTKKQSVRALLCRWHYDKNTWRQLQVHCKLSGTA
jgi:hypothetical protein